MKRLDVYAKFAAGLLALAVGGCAGEEGPMGPEGPIGLTGPTGPQGETGPAGGVKAYAKTGQWYDGASFTRTFEHGEQILTLDLPGGSYLLTAYVALRPSSTAPAQTRISCSVAPSGASAGKSDATWVAALDGTNTISISVVGTGGVNAGVADLRCYSSQAPFAVSQASLTAIPIAQLTVQ